MEKKKQIITLDIRNSYYMFGIKTLLLVILLWVIAWPGAIKAQTNIKIHPSTVNEIGGYAEVQELFGVMVTGGNPDIAEFLKEANVTGIRNIIKVVNPGDLDFKFPPWTIDKPENKRFETKAQAEAWFDAFISRDPEPLWTQQLKPVDVYFDGRFGKANVTICGNPRVFDARMERNLEASKDHVIAYLNAVKQIEMQEGSAAFKYFQLSNEPEQGRNWTGYFDVEPMPVINEDRDMDSLYLSKDQRLGSQSYTRVFNYLYDEISTRFPDITFVGNCIGHDGAYRLDAPGKKPHMNWNTWVKYYIDSIRNPEALEYFNVQTYRIPTLRNLAYVSMTQNYAEMKRGVRPRYFISETNAPAGGDKNYLNQFIFNSSEIMTMLENPGKYAVRQGYIATPGDNYNYFYYKNNQLHPRSSYHVLDILKHVRGTNVYYETDKNVIKVFASAPDKNRIVLALFNPRGSQQEININPGLPAVKIKEIKQRKAVWSQSSLTTLISSDTLSIESPLQMTLEPVSLHAIEIHLKDKLSFNKVSRSREYYGDTIQASLSAPLSYDIEIRDFPDDNGNAFLRIAFKKKPGPGNYSINLNGNNYNYDLSELPDKKIETWHDMVGFIEIPLNNDDLQTKNNISLDPLSDNTLLFSSIVLKNLKTPLQKASFKIYESKDQQIIPLQNAAILLNNKKTCTNNSGNASMDGLLTGEFNYRIEKKGYKGLTKRITIASDTTFIDTLESTSYDVSLHIIDKDTDMPVDGAKLEFNGNNYTANPEGLVQIQGISYNFYSAGVSKSQYVSKRFEGIEIYSDTTITLKIHKTYYNASVKIIDKSTKEPITRANIYINDQHYITGDNGEATITELYSDLWKYTVEAYEYLTHDDSMNIKNDTNLVIALFPVTANIQFQIKTGTEPVSGASTALNGFSTTSTDEGIALFLNQDTKKKYMYTINKEGYRLVSDSLYLEIDTTLDISLEQVNSIYHDQEENISIYPNPVSKRLHVVTNIQKSNIQIISSNGMILKDIKLESGINSMDVSELRKGIYIIKVVSNNLTTRTKIIK